MGLGPPFTTLLIQTTRPKTISPTRFAPSLWTIRPQSLDDSPPVFGRLAPSLSRREQKYCWSLTFRELVAPKG